MYKLHTFLSKKCYSILQENYCQTILMLETKVTYLKNQVNQIAKQLILLLALLSKEYSSETRTVLPARMKLSKYHIAI